MDFEKISDKFTDFLSRNQSTSIEINAFAKYTSTLPDPELFTLIGDVYDELMRRENGIVPFLPILLHLSSVRNQARQKLATLGPESFIELVTALSRIIQQRGLHHQTIRRKMNVELKKLEGKATARSMDRMKPLAVNVDVQGSGSGPKSAPVDHYPVSDHPPMPAYPTLKKSTTPIEKSSGWNTPNPVDERYENLLKEHEQLKSKFIDLVAELKQVKQELRAQVYKNQELVNLVQLKQIQLNEVSQQVNTSTLPRSTTTATATPNNDTFAQSSTQQQPPLASSTVSTHPPVRYSKTRSQKQQLDKLSQELQTAIQQMDKKSVISITKSFLLLSKSISDEYDTDLDTKLGENIKQLMSSAKVFHNSLDPSVCNPFITNLVETVDTLTQILDQATRTSATTMTTITTMGDVEIETVEGLVDLLLQLIDQITESTIFETVDFFIFKTSETASKLNVSVDVEPLMEFMDDECLDLDLAKEVLVVK